MDLQRLFLFLIFVFSLVLVWDGWQRYQHPEAYTQNKSVLGEDQSKSPVLRTVESVNSPILNSNVSEQRTHDKTGELISVKTDLMDVEIDTIGGDISYLSLLKHSDGEDKNKPFVLFSRRDGGHNYTAQSGLLGIGLPNHNSQFKTDHNQYEIKRSSEQLHIRLTAVDDSPLKVTKVMTFYNSRYQIDVSYELENTSLLAVVASSYFQLVRDSVAPAGSSRFLPTYTGVAVYTEKEKFKKVQFSDIEKSKVDYEKLADNGWIGMLQHYFVAAWLPLEKAKREFFTRKVDGDLYAAGVILPDLIINPGQKSIVNMTLYAGPAQTKLDKIAPGLGLTVDYGWLTIIATPLFWVMTLFNDWTGNWGVAIILLTILIKLIFFPLSAASYRSMAKMRLVAPKLEKIKQQYPDDREQLNRAMMELYKTEKINPLGGCLPVVIQIPVFIALYWSILSSVEMRYAPFFGWITDLSAADPYYILPVIMGLSMIVQMRLNPKPPDPIQAKVMQIMPIAFSVIFFFFPAGLVLYSVVNNLLSIAQQWYITKSAEHETKGASAKR